MLNTNEQQVTIDLSSSERNGPIEPNNLIQGGSFKKLTSQIKERLENKEKKEQSPPALGNSQVFFIDGTRGAGKSTFLSAVYHALTSEENAEIKGLRLKALQLLDPSKINIREHLFLSIVYRIKKLIENTTTAYQSYSDLSNEKSEKFRKQFKELAGGLQLLNDNHNPLDGIDEEVFLDLGIERARDGVELAKNFHKLVETTCEILKVDALVIAIDDADTNFKKGREVLELIRCYLDSPHFIVLITGDLELYSHLVRDHYYENIGERLHQQDPTRNPEREKLIDHLEDQYLLKLFPINKRIHLSPLWSFEKSIKDISITHPKWGTEKRNLDETLKSIIKTGFRLKSDQDINLFREFLLKQPLRSILQLLNSCAPHLIEKNQTISPQILSESMRAMVLGSLYKKGIDTDALTTGDITTLIDAVFRLALEDGEFDTGAYLRPQPKDESLRKCFAALSAEVARHCEGSPQNTIMYLLQGPGSVALYKDARKSIKIDSDELALTWFKNYFSIGRQEDALNWAWHAAPVIMGASSSIRAIKCGVLGLNRSSSGNTNKDLIPIKEILDSIGKEYEAPAFSYTLINVFDKDNRTYASIFNVLGLMCRLLLPSSKDSTNHVAFELVRISTTPTISAPRWSDNVGTDDTDEKDPEDDQISAIEKTKFVENTAMWLDHTNSLSPSIKPSAVLIGKIWTRLYFSLINCAQTYRIGSGTNAGPATIMEFFALCVINAVLVEEHDHHYSSDIEPNSSSNFRKNPQTAGSTINSKFINIDMTKYPLTAIIGGCPLLLNLLPQKNTYKELFDKLAVNKEQNPGCPTDIFEKINCGLIVKQSKK